MEPATAQRFNQTTQELMHVDLNPVEMETSDDQSISIGGLGLVQVGRDALSQRIASGWMEKVSGREIREKIRKVVEGCLRNLARGRTAAEIRSHWAGVGQLLDVETRSAFKRMGLEFIGFLPGGGQIDPNSQTGRKGLKRFPKSSFQVG